MLLNVVEINSAVFNHFPKTKRLVAELSDLQINHFDRLYDDATDVGFSIRNPKTGNVTRWALTNEVRDSAENELIAFNFIPTPESLRAQHALQGYTMTLLND